ncbi:metallophosphoesterase [Nocardioides caeni]|uniref:Metallophosphoesterase n=1 Tax=Nocardioides caeni TaxID=574700 RepID=A0A4S8NHJ0_9ACTN|nr:metallophosphoesterase [Nocardioides caeni]THV14609.1 metallophosphoesterase [Nocardioides caeni]
MRIAVDVRVLLRLLLGAGVWLVLSIVLAGFIFAGSERSIDLASHDATVSPDYSGQIVLRTGPVLPDLRAPSDSRLGLEIRLGKSDTTSLEELTTRYAAIASQPEGQVAAVGRAVRSMAIAALLQGAALAALPLVLWVVVGPTRRRELLARLRTRGGVAGLVAIALVVGLAVVPLTWGRAESPEETWEPLQAFVGEDVPLPDEARDVEIMDDVTTEETQRLITSAVSTYQRSLTFYSDAADRAGELELRTPEEDETVVVIVSDRHLNVGMDKVARAIGDRAEASALFDLGDDTSTGERWEAFSLDSVAAAFDDYDGHWGVAGNHDHGGFVRSHLEDLGWTYFDGEVVDGPGDSRIIGVDDPRSSGLGNWRDETGLTSAEVAEALTEEVCRADEEGDRVSTVLLHDADFGDAALERGCVDLVLGGHVHVQSGPTPVEGEGGETGYTYTLGTTGGAAYAIAIGSKLRRAASIGLLTYREGRPVGLQSIELQSNGRFDVHEWVELTY